MAPNTYKDAYTCSHQENTNWSQISYQLVTHYKGMNIYFLKVVLGIAKRNPHMFLVEMLYGSLSFLNFTPNYLPKGNEYVYTEASTWMFIETLFLTAPKGNNKRSISRWMDKETLKYAYNRILIGYLKDQTTDALNNMNKYFLKNVWWVNNASLKRYPYLEIIYMHFWIEQKHKRQKAS